VRPSTPEAPAALLPPPPLRFLPTQFPGGSSSGSFHSAPLDCRDESRLSRSTSIAFGEEDWAPRYNVAPTQPVPVIRQNPREPIRELSLIHWGLIPSWSKDSSAAAKMINARSETASTKPAFAEALKFRRCLIPADGFYEWAKLGKSKQPYCLEVNDGNCSHSQGSGISGGTPAARSWRPVQS
jgi:hypothetical protein